MLIRSIWSVWFVSLDSMRARSPSILIPADHRNETKPKKPLQPLGKKYTVMDVMMMLASAIGNMTFQPNRIN